VYTRLGKPRYISLTTRRRDESLASTPVWVVSDDGRRLLVWTGATTWKAKRIRRDPRVLVAACDARGRERGPRLAGRARILDDGGRDLVVPLLRRKYGWQRRLLELISAFRRGPRPAQAYIEITDDRAGRQAAATLRSSS
jgi:PPOX class probable F420-dependent enzyme